MIELTVADVLAELERIGADPKTTTFEVPSGPIMRLDGEYAIVRDGGAAVVSFPLVGHEYGCPCACDEFEDDETAVNAEGAKG